MKIVITGGVLTPALAVIAELQKRGSWEIYYLGRKYAMEGEKIPSMESKMWKSHLGGGLGRTPRKF